MVTVDPKEISKTGKPNQTEATVTVQIFHLALASEQSVVLGVGTGVTDTQTGVAVGYRPATQTVRLPPSPAGKVNATVKVSKPQMGANTQATVTIVATLQPGSPGIRIGH